MLLFAAVVIIICLALSRFSSKVGLPTLAVFIGLGMLFGTDGLFRVAFDNYEFAEQICSVSLIFIMFYGGFGTNWKRAKATAPMAVLLSTAGVVVTAVLTGVFCRFVLGMDWLPALLVGSVISSTDAASVFSILRSRRLNLRYGTASLLEVESGSNDPFSYMMTFIVLTLMGGEASAGGMVWMMASQIVFGLAVGAVTAYIGRYLFRHIRLNGDGYDSMLIFAMALLSYGLSSVIGGNGYLSVYVTGLMLGNMPLHGKKTLVHFFDGVTGLMQILIFFLLGLLSYPSQLPEVALQGLLIALFLTFVARPAAVFAVMSPFKCPLRQKLLVSWSGLRGAASIVFAIMATVNPAVTPSSLFNTVFFIVLFSIILQGSLIPAVARKLDMIDDEGDVMKTFSDYSEETPVQFMKLHVTGRHPWAGKELRHLRMTPQTRIALILREGEEIIPRGETCIRLGDTIILSGPAMEGGDWGRLTEVTIDHDHDWCNRPLKVISANQECHVVMIRRGTKTLIPDGSTVILKGDVLVVNDI